MRVEVVGRNLDITDAIRAHAEEKVEKLHRFFDGVQLITVTATRLDHSATHPVFEAELIIDVRNHEDFVARATGEDLYAVIDQVVQKGSRQLADYKDKLKLGKR
ncbi:MAG: ribosome hibernation-promoting factor, HPF/YfiA family [Phycisphaerales bacterium JB039]